MTETELTARNAAADSALALELITRFFIGQIDAGAVLREEIAAHMRDCAARVGSIEPAFADRAMLETERLIAGLPAGWAEGDWQDPA